MANEPGHSPEAPARPFAVPCATLDHGAPLRWLRAGWRDYRRAPGLSLLFGVVVVLVDADDIPQADAARITEQAGIELITAARAAMGHQQAVLAQVAHQHFQVADRHGESIGHFLDRDRLAGRPGRDEDGNLDGLDYFSGNHVSSLLVGVWGYFPS